MRIRRWLRIVGIVLVVLVAVAAMAAAATWLVLRSSWGQKKLTSWVANQAQKAIHGHVGIGTIRMPHWGVLRIENLDIDDVEKNRVIHVEEIEAKWSLHGLRNGYLSALSLHKTTLFLRRMKDQTINVEQLVDMSTPSIGMYISSLVLDGEVDARGLDARIQPVSFKWASTLENKPDRLRLSGITAHLNTMQDVRLPDMLPTNKIAEIFGSADGAHALQLGVDCAGSMEVGAKGMAFSSMRLTLLGVPSDVISSKWVRLQGPVTVDAVLEGASSDLQVDGELVMPIGNSFFRAKRAVVDNREKWEGSLFSSWKKLGDWFPVLAGISHQSRLQWSKTDENWSASMDAFSIESGTKFFRAEGVIRGKSADLQAATVSVSVNWPAIRLDRMLQPIPALSGGLVGDAKLSLESGQWNGWMQFHGKQWQFGQNRLRDLSVAVQVEKNQIKASILGLGAKMGGWVFDRLGLTAKVQGRKGRFLASGTGPQNLLFSMGGQGGLEQMDGEVRSAAVVLNKMSLSFKGLNWMLRRSATVSWDRSRSLLEIGKMIFFSEGQRLSFDGFYSGTNDQIQLRVDINALNLQKISRLFAAGAVLPKTAFALHAEVTGTTKKPQARIFFVGKADAFEKLDWQQTEYRLNATWEGSQIKGSLSANSTRTRIQAAFSIPLNVRTPLMLQLRAKLPLQLVRALLPDSLNNVEGDGELTLDVGGTLHHPSLSMELGIPSWRFVDLHGQNATLALSFKNGQFHMSGKIALQNQQGVSLGTATMLSSAESKWEDWVSSSSMKQHLWNLSWKTTVVAHLEKVGDLAPAWLQSRWPVRSGMADVEIQMDGSFADPTLRASFRGRQWVIGPLKEAPLDATLDAVYKNKEVSFSLAVDWKGKPWIQGRGGAKINFEEWLQDPKRYTQAPLDAQVTFLPYDLSGVSPWSGLVQGTFVLRGTPAKPQLSLAMSAQMLRFGDLLVPKVEINALSDGIDPFFRAQIRFLPKKGTEYAQFDARIPWSFEPGKVTASFIAKRFSLEYETARPEWFGIRLLRGILDANLSFKMREGQPVINGNATLNEGALSTNFDRRLYKDVQAQITMQPSAIGPEVTMSLKGFSATVGGGTVRGEGSATLFGTQLTQSRFLFSTEQVTLFQGALHLKLDAQVEVTAAQKGPWTLVDVRAIRGKATIPKLLTDGDLQSIEVPAQIRYTDTLAKQLEKSRRRTEKLLGYFQTAGNTKVNVVIPSGVFKIQGPEINVGAEGNLVIETGSENQKGEKSTKIDGSIKAISGGYVVLFDKQYDLNEAGLLLTGSVSALDPQINLRMVRPISDGGLLTIRVEGPVSKPSIFVSADPAKYTQAQLLTLAAGGEIATSDTNGSDPGLNASGVISSLLIGQLKGKLDGLIPIDTLRINADLDTGLSGIEVSKYLLGNSLAVSYSYTPTNSRVGQGAQNVHQACIQYVFLRGTKICEKHPILCNFQLNSCLGDAGLGNLSLLWRFPIDYRQTGSKSAETSHSEKK